jgi:hypothetical protein
VNKLNKFKDGEPLQCHMLAVVEWEGVATVEQHRSWVLSARVCKAGRHGTHHLHWVGFRCTVELEGADAAVGWWESSVQCGDTARGVCAWMRSQARGGCRSIRLPPQPSLLLSRQGTATLRSWLDVAIVHAYSSTSNHLQKWERALVSAPNPACGERWLCLHA